MERLFKDKMLRAGVFGMIVVEPLLILKDSFNYNPFKLYSKNSN